MGGQLAGGNLLQPLPGAEEAEAVPAAQQLGALLRRAIARDAGKDFGGESVELCVRSPIIARLSPGLQFPGWLEAALA